MNLYVVRYAGRFQAFTTRPDASRFYRAMRESYPEARLEGAHQVPLEETADIPLRDIIGSIGGLYYVRGHVSKGASK